MSIYKNVFLLYSVSRKKTLNLSPWSLLINVGCNFSGANLLFAQPQRIISGSSPVKQWRSSNTLGNKTFICLLLCFLRTNNMCVDSLMRTPNMCECHVTYYWFWRLEKECKRKGSRSSLSWIIEIHIIIFFGFMHYIYKAATEIRKKVRVGKLISLWGQS